MKSRRSTKDFLDRIDEAAQRLPAKPAASSESAHVVPREVGYVGKALASSNRTLDDRVEEATRLAAEKEIEASELRAKLESGTLAVKIDPSRIRASAFADRHPKAFEDDEFLAFVDEIKATGGNREPGTVRPIHDNPDYDYELAAGHRRHRACLVAGLDYFCFVRDLSDEELLVSMATENKGRKDLSNFERGRHYARLLADKKFSSLRKMSEAFNEPLTVMHRLIAYGDLPELVVGAFSDPRAIRSGWIAPLIDAYKRNPAAVEAEVEAVRADTKLSPTDVYKRLTGANGKASIVAGSDRVLASVRMIHDRRAIVLYKGAPDELVDKLKDVIEAYHKDHEDAGR